MSNQHKRCYLISFLGVKEVLSILSATNIYQSCEKRFVSDPVYNEKSLVIRQKGESQNGCFKKAKHAKISEKQTFLTS